MDSGCESVRLGEAIKRQQLLGQSSQLHRSRVRHKHKKEGA
jgi:hypothetical protein